jgi:hypothetical protein
MWSPYCKAITRVRPTKITSPECPTLPVLRACAHTHHPPPITSSQTKQQLEDRMTFTSTLVSLAALAAGATARHATHGSSDAGNSGSSTGKQFPAACQSTWTQNTACLYHGTGNCVNGKPLNGGEIGISEEECGILCAAQGTDGCCEHVSFNRRSCGFDAVLPSPWESDCLCAST